MKTKLVIPAIIMAAMMIGMVYAVLPVQEATTVHTTIKSNIEQRPNIITVGPIPVNGSFSQAITPKVTDGYLGLVFVSVDSGNQTSSFLAASGGSLVNTFRIIGDIDGNGPNTGDTEIVNIRQGEFSNNANIVRENGTIGTSTTATNVDQIFVTSNLTWPGGDNPDLHATDRNANPIATIILVLNNTKTVA